MTRVHLTGFPKHGNHALAKAVQLLGVPCQVIHIPWSEEMAYRDAPRLMIVRDLRDALVSWLRMKQLPVTPGMVMTRLRQWADDESGTLVEQLAKYEGWLDDPTTLKVKYESLVETPLIMQWIADHLGVPYPAGAWEQLAGGTRTWNRIPSDYEPVWTPDVEQVWQEIGGPAALERWRV